MDVCSCWTSENFGQKCYHPFLKTLKKKSGFETGISNHFYTYWKRRAFLFLASAELAVEDERSWWFGCSGTWVPQTLWYCGNWKILVQGISRLWKAKRSWCKNSIVLLAYSSLRMEANFWFWIYILDLAVLLLYPWMVLHSRWLWLSVTVAILTVLG